MNGRGSTIAFLPLPFLSFAEAEGFYLILSSYFRAIESEEALTRVADSITKAATASTESKTTLRLKM